MVEPVMRSYMDATDGSTIEFKESALVWHHQEADPDFGACQAKELLDHLESVLANEPVVVKRGQHIVEVKPQVTSDIYIIFFFYLHLRIYQELIPSYVIESILCIDAGSEQRSSRGKGDTPNGRGWKPTGHGNVYRR